MRKPSPRGVPSITVGMRDLNPWPQPSTSTPALTSGGELVLGGEHGERRARRRDRCGAVDGLERPAGDGVLTAVDGRERDPRVARLRVGVRGGHVGVRPTLILGDETLPVPEPPLKASGRSPNANREPEQLGGQGDGAGIHINVGRHVDERPPVGRLNMHNPSRERQPPKLPNPKNRNRSLRNLPRPPTNSLISITKIS